LPVFVFFAAMLAGAFAYDRWARVRTRQ
jgi:hypothetical protein